jgi:hypothetical protein
MIMSKRTVKRVVEAWNDLDSDPEKAADDVVALLHHPFFADEQDEGHKELAAYVEEWVGRLGEEKEEVLSRRAFRWLRWDFANACCSHPRERRGASQHE